MPNHHAVAVYSFVIHHCPLMIYLHHDQSLSERKITKALKVTFNEIIREAKGALTVLMPSPPSGPSALWLSVMEEGRTRGKVFQ